MTEQAASGSARRSLPWLTFAAVGLNILLTVVGVFEPGLVTALQRQPSMVGDAELWRFITALFIYSDAWWKIAIALALFVVAGVLVERLYARAAWFAGFVAGGLVGEYFGIFWQPVGCGISVAGGGLLGVLLYGLAGDRRRTLPERIVWPACGAVAAIALCLLRDIHGPPILAGAAVGPLVVPARPAGAALS